MADLPLEPAFVDVHHLPGLSAAGTAHRESLLSHASHLVRRSPADLRAHVLRVLMAQGLDDSEALCAALLASAPREASANPAQRVYAGIYLRDVTRFDQRNGTFDVDMEAWVKWLGDFDPTMLRIANESSLSRDDLGTEDDAGWHVRRWRLRGTLRGEFPLQRFPFDDQALGVAFELPERDGVRRVGERCVAACGEVAGLVAHLHRPGPRLAEWNHR